jgi:hypothetical protein
MTRHTEGYGGDSVPSAHGSYPEGGALHRGCLAVHTGQWVRLLAPSPVPLGRQRLSLLRWVMIPMARHTFAGAAPRYLLDGMPGVRLPGSAV